MTRRKVGIAVLVALGCLAALPGVALAQSSIGGTVKDTSGGVLPGVTVEVSSDALIEKVKSTTTDNNGTYRIVDLRPGMYSVKFSLTGFTTVARAAFQLVSEFSARIDAEMKVGAMEETITVTGAAPIVDVQSAAHVQVLDRDAIDNIPTGKTIPGLGQLILGVNLNAPDVGGSAGAMNTYMSLHGNAVSAANNTVMVDGMVINGLMLDGAVQTYTNDADFQEMTYQTAGIGAMNSGGGVTVNMIPKEGGNRFSGSGSGAYRPGQLQGDNYSDRFKTWGLPVDKNGDPAINRIKRISDFNGSEGGPIKKDKLWFFASGRAFAPINTVPNTFLDDGTQGLDDNYIRNSLVRLTYQLSPRHKIGAYYERVFKWRGHDMNALADPETTALVWTSPNYSTESVKYTGTLSSRLLIEAGFSQNVEYYRNLFQSVDAASNVATYGALCCGDGVEKARFTAAWFAQPSHTTALGGVGVAPGGTVQQFPNSQVAQGSASYVTGMHHAKVGASVRRGQFMHGGGGNADLSQIYPSFFRDENFNILFPTTTLDAAQFAADFPTLVATGRPCNKNDGTSVCSVTIRNSPRQYQETLNYDAGFFAQDSFTMKRLTVNAGIRYEMLNSQVDVTTSDVGRFVPARTTVEQKNIPNWRDWAPRFQVVYDLFGNSKTAIKYSFNRYNESVTTSVAADANPIVLTTSTRNWTDLNNDDIAQGQRTFNADGTFTDCVYLTPGCEIYLSGPGSTQTALSSTYGLLSEPGQFNQFPRRYRLEHGVEIQHALLPRLSLTGTFYHGSNHNFTNTVNRNRLNPETDTTQYRKVALFNPLTGEPFTYYNGLVTIAADNLTDLEPLRKNGYDSYSGEFRMRPYAGAQLSGGISIERSLTKNCGTSFTKADGSPAFVDPNSLYNCDQWNLVQYEGGPKYDKPYNKSFKMSGAFPIVYGINFGVSYQNIDAGDGSGSLNPTFLYGTAFKYPDGTTTMLGKSTAVPACPTTYGCVPGAFTTPANFVGAATGTSIGANFAPGAIRDERIAQLDIRASKNLRFGRISVQPTVEAFNILNIDQVRGRQSVSVGNVQGTYLQPSTMLQGRIIGFGANVKW